METVRHMESSALAILKFLDNIKGTQNSKKITLRCHISYQLSIEAYYTIKDYKSHSSFHELLLTEDDDFAETAGLLIMLLDYPTYENRENEIVIKNYSVFKIKKILKQYTNQ